MTSSPKALTLYYTPISFFSQKGLLILHEKQVPFKSCTVDVTRGETYRPWFMRMNPKGTVPVLKAGEEIIADSGEIAIYMDQNYAERQLIPSTSTEQGQKAKHFIQLLDSLNLPILTFGGLLYPELLVQCRIPDFIRKAAVNRVQSNTFVTFVENGKRKNTDPALESVYEEKLKTAYQFVADLRNKDKVIAERSKLRDVLNEVEKELRKTKEENPNKETWLCGEEFLLPDIQLGLLLHRAYAVGYSGALWENGLLPNVDEYYKKVLLRKSFQEVVVYASSPRFLFKMALKAYAPRIALGTVVGVGIGVGLYLYFRKK